MQVEATHLLTINSFTAINKMTTSAIYKRIKENKLVPYVIDCIKFINITNHQNFKTK
jgi:hypothetical protein